MNASRRMKQMMANRSRTDRARRELKEPQPVPTLSFDTGEQATA